MSKVFVIVFGGLLVALLLYGPVARMYENRELEDCSVDAKAFLDDVVDGRQSSYKIKYSYKVKGVKYTSWERMPPEMDQGGIYVPGDSIPIVYACDYPDASRFKSKSVFEDEK